jgi:Lon protease-like protein
MVSTGPRPDRPALGPGEALLPLFPLGLVLVPGLVLPLHLFEPRYLLLHERLEALPEPDRLFGVVAIREGHEVGADAVRSLHAVGCTAVLRSSERHGDGTVDVVAVGDRRFRLLEVHDDEPYATATVSWLEEPAGDDAARLAAAVIASFGRYVDAVAGTSGIVVPTPDELPDDPQTVSYLVSAAAVLDLGERQRLLEEPDHAARLRALLGLLRRETVLAEALPSVPAGDLARTAATPN